MNQPSAPPIPNAAPPKRRSRWRVVLALFALLLLVPILFWIYTIVSTRQAWAEAEAEAALDIPRWRLMELEADRPNILDKDNSALHSIAVRGKAGRVGLFAMPSYDKIFDKLPPTAQLNKQQIELTRTELAKIPEGLAEARKLKDLPRGRFPITYSDDAISTLVPDHQDSRLIIYWLNHDAMLLAQDKEYGKAVESCQAILNMGRAFEGELFLIGHLIRVAEQSIAVVALERVLAQGQASEERLLAMQTLLAKDLDGNGWVQTVRGERAMFHHLFENVRSGKVDMNGFSGFGRGAPANIFDSPLEWLVDTFPSILLKYYPEYLRHMNRCVDIAKLPHHERAPTLAQWEAECKTTKNPVIRMLTPAMSKVSSAETRRQALAASALAGVACERYRLKHRQVREENTWPDSLDVLVKEGLLDAIPLDPFDGKALRYHRTKDGVVIYSVGADLVDNEGHIDRDQPIGPGVDIGFRLWNVERRRQKALPPVVISE